MVFSAGSALAASPDYCAVYAIEFAKQVSPNEGKLSAELIHDRLYHKCLNMDEDPPLPNAYAEARPDGVGKSLVEGSESPAAILDDAEAPTVDATAIDEAIVKRTAAIEGDHPKMPAKQQSQGRWRGSGYAMGSPEWKNWCAEHFPNSFDPKTGTVMPYKTEVREPCL